MEHLYGSCRAGGGLTGPHAAPTLGPAPKILRVFWRWFHQCMMPSVAQHARSALHHLCSSTAQRHKNEGADHCHCGIGFVVQKTVPSGNLRLQIKTSPRSLQTPSCLVG
ncbi:hypothetical protein GDO81_019066 [Engystomops pustulosus]|uniref:Uncharacterized protein n=1 Tax=Engystomops pustulosus TaxID=76066 RepID=A0AAV6YT37_ENGPU|nr:hypothetical protein GDO81_019066 [Engystomops pustulosus]